MKKKNSQGAFFHLLNENSQIAFTKIDTYKRPIPFLYWKLIQNLSTCNLGQIKLFVFFMVGNCMEF